jgi:hypothetical protein
MRGFKDEREEGREKKVFVFSSSSSPLLLLFDT